MTHRGTDLGRGHPSIDGERGVEVVALQAGIERVEVEPGEVERSADGVAGVTATWHVVTGAGGEVCNGAGLHTQLRKWEGKGGGGNVL